MTEVQRFEVGGVSLGVRVWACRRPVHRAVVLLPGTGLTATDWDVVAGDLSQDRTVHAVDLRGHGESGRPGTYSIELMTADVESLLPQLGEDFDLVGHSLGGLVACRVAARSSAIRNLVLEDVGLIRPRRPSMPSRPRGDLPFDWSMVEQVRPEIDVPGSDWADVLRRITASVLAIGGGPRSFVPQEWVADLVDTVPSGRLVTIDAGHEIHATRPTEFLAAVHGFLDTSGSGAP
ncbi:MAG: alpha/beta hydrolase [Knoellia sp.]